MAIHSTATQCSTLLVNIARIIRGGIIAGIIGGGIIGLVSTGSAAAEEEREMVYTLPDVEVIARSPVMGSGTPIGESTTHVQVVGARALERSFDLADALNRHVGGISVNDVQNNPYQKDIQFRGYTVSPLLGMPQGLAIYQNGIRVNEAFGEVVQWDTVPEFAISEVQVIAGANPIFGLNALGGAITLRMKNGFDNPGIRVKVSGGSFGRFQSSGEAGMTTADGQWASWLGYHVFREDGWRDYSKSDVQQIYGDVRRRDERTEIGFSTALSTSKLRGNGPVPIQLLRERRDSVYTHPDITENTSVLLALDGRFDVTNNFSLSGNAYYRFRNRNTLNGDEFDSEECHYGTGVGVPPNPLADTITPAQNTALNQAYLTGEDGFKQVTVSSTPATTADVCATGSDDAADDVDLSTAHVLRDIQGNLIPSDGFKKRIGTEDAIGEEVADGAINRSKIYINTFGIASQGVWDALLFDRENSLMTGLSFDYAKVSYKSSSELGNLNPSRGIDPHGGDSQSAPRGAVFLGRNADGYAVPVNLESETKYLGLYFSDTIRWTDPLSMTISGRWNHADIEMLDRFGTALNGSHSYNRFNPAIGFNYRIQDDWHAFTQYSEANRVPTASELGCADPDNPCRLPNAFLADPPLKQVVNRSFEVGMRGDNRWFGTSLRWDASLFHGINSDDIIFVAAKTLGTGYFRNAGETRRMGAQIGLVGAGERFDWFLNYSYVRATFESPLDILSPGHPRAKKGDDADSGKIHVAPGDRIPGIPLHNLKFGAGYTPLQDWRVGFDTIVSSSQYLRGDESNQLDPVAAYAVVNLNSDYRLTKNLTVFLQIHNLFDTQYETFGIVAENPSEVLGDKYNDARFFGPAPPLGIWGGIRAQF